jgi:hypothetical protein
MFPSAAHLILAVALFAAHVVCAARRVQLARTLRRCTSMAATLYRLRSNQASTSAHLHLMTGQRQQDQQVRTGGCPAARPALDRLVQSNSQHACETRMVCDRLLRLAESAEPCKVAS